MRFPLTRVRSVAPLLVLPFLLTACGEEEGPPVRVDRSSDCKTQGTVDAEPLPTIRAAVAPYLQPTQELEVAKKFGETATVNLRERDGGAITATVTLVRTADGWVPSNIVRCGG